MPENHRHRARNRRLIIEDRLAMDLTSLSNERTLLNYVRTALAFLAAVNGVPLTPLGVTRFGQSGDLEEVYRHHGIDAETVVGAALDLL